MTMLFGRDGFCFKVHKREKERKCRNGKQGDEENGLSYFIAVLR